MWEVLLTAEVGKFVLDKVLDLGKSVLEDYVKDFFKGCIEGTISAAKADILKQPMADAIGQFVKRFVKELQINGVEKPSIDHHYGKVIKQFVQDKAVRPVLGKAFETHCRAIDYQQLEIIWQQGYLNSGYRFPDEFDWRGVAKEYVFEVKGIVKGDAELRSLLTIDLQEKQTDSLKHLAGINPGLDVEKYRESLQCSYGYLKLYALDSTYQADAIKLWRMFIEQTVREALPPLRYEVPLDVKRQLQAEGGLEDDLSAEALAVYRQEYFQQPARKVLGAIGDSQQAVILGDPGAGKSTLLQYLALEWVEGKTRALPLLIELREYVLDGMKGFLEFWHRGRGADWQFDLLQLHQHLLEQPTIVMFDGLDEVFDRATQSAIVDDIVRFSQQYPKVQVLVTSRIIGYNPERLQQAGFKQFTIQPLDREEIHEFIDRWYDLALGADPDKVRLVNRLKDAIENSKAIQNLADNPLLLTMMAILNREKEPPTKRSDLYDRASRVLLDKWDSESKNFPVDKIEPWVKQGILRHIAHEMQTSEEGLKGNLIRADRLVRILTDYLKDQGFEGPREKANGLIEQLRHRNWILCDRGADTYGFVHRTFLEYFCAMEIVHRFEKARTITFEQLRDEVFGQHWQDETWHEVLRLICGSIDSQFSGQIIEFLVTLVHEPDKEYETDKTFPNSYDGQWAKSLFLSSQCLADIKNCQLMEPLSCRLTNGLMKLAQFPYFDWSKESVSQSIANDCKRAIQEVANVWGTQIDVKNWLQMLLDGENWIAHGQAIRELSKHDQDNPDTLVFLKTAAFSGSSAVMRIAAVQQLASIWMYDSDTLEIVKSVAVDEEEYVRLAAIKLLCEQWILDDQVFDFLCQRIALDPFVDEYSDALKHNLRWIALSQICKIHPNSLKTLELLHDRAQNDPDDQLRQWAQEQLQKQSANP
jgi:GTPase SAR1 family protein